MAIHVERRVLRGVVLRANRTCQRLTIRLGDEFRVQRLRAGLSQTDVAAAIGASRSTISRLESGDPSVGLVVWVRAAEVLGGDLWISLYAGRSPSIIDRVQSRMLERLLARVAPTWRRTLESPIPGRGRRSSDLRIESTRAVVLFELESRAVSWEALLRELHDKREAVAAVEGPSGRPVFVVLVLQPSRAHQALVRDLRESRLAALPTPSSVLDRALSGPAGPWPGDGILWVGAGAD